MKCGKPRGNKAGVETSLLYVDRFHLSTSAFRRVTIPALTETFRRAIYSYEQGVSLDMKIKIALILFSGLVTIFGSALVGESQQRLRVVSEPLPSSQPNPLRRLLKTILCA